MIIFRSNIIYYHLFYNIPILITEKLLVQILNKLISIFKNIILSIIYSKRRGFSFEKENFVLPQFIPKVPILRTTRERIRRPTKTRFFWARAYCRCTRYTRYSLVIRLRKCHYSDARAVWVLSWYGVWYKINSRIRKYGL